MRAILPHLVKVSLVALAPLALAACDPNLQGGGAPVTRGPAAMAGCGPTVTTYSGDTVYSIARRCNVSVRELIEANRLQAPYQINGGMVLRIPGGSGEYVVQRGDTLLIVARRLGVDFQALARTNGKSAPYTIFVGEKLRVPGSYGAATQTAQAVQPGSSLAGSPLVIASPNAAPGIKAPAKPYSATTSRPAEAASPPEPDNHVLTSVPPPAPPPAVPVAAPAQQQASLPPPAPPPLAGRGFIWPVKGEMVNEFGPMAKGQHNDGVNIVAPRGTPVKAAENGVVAYVGNELKGFGNLLLIKHADGWMTAYAHNDQLMVRKGEQVRKGQQIATVGSSGNVNQPQLHFEIRRGTEAVNPADYIKGDTLSRLLGDPGGA
ncbi:MAG TPA: LysM peptidoglycan-binding domain-containing M23 family metallopeptidase [Magnetospirillum sp.]|jgi:murein DD-endopeptidase MepM/ murein hydrolase activator NlpD|nr:LysM peptidoglycan-binding domain-containing M23 family metallopeptidase [Magnetospirillum sp.]